MRRIDVDIPDDDFDRLRRWKERRGLTWRGVLVEAADELPDGEEVAA